MTNYKHLSYEDRKNIEDGLNENKSINQIAKELNRNHSSIYREIDRNRKYSEPSTWNNYKINHPNVDLSCERLKHSPYVCNGCKSRSGCRKVRWTYYAREAQKDYEELIKSCRQGINLNVEEIHTINEVITPLVKKGQTTNHLYINHPDILDFSKSSFYRYINDGVFEFGPLDFPRIVKYKKRKNSKDRRTRKEREILKGRKYVDFIEYTSNNPDLNIVEMDTVEGLQEEGDCFLTLLWRKSKFMLIFKLENQTTEEVSRIFNILQEVIPFDIYKKLFQVILTDNGHEFFDVNNIECIQSTGEYITHLFFCDPHASRQKGAIEKNHEFIRYILPKGSSFKNINQEDCNSIMNNINSLCRDSLNGKSPYEAMLFLCDEYILKLLNCYYIKPDEVNLTNNLLKY
ncbi:MAG: IS30 family transposase [Alphaproteobacteria bacterium]|nr:IS30 family transposase [Alphaproteobacteria bacterium]